MKPASFSTGLIRLTQTQRGDTSGQLTSQWSPMKSTSLPFQFPCPPCSREGLAQSHAHSLAHSLCDQGPPLQAVWARLIMSLLPGESRHQQPLSLQPFPRFQHKQSDKVDGPDCPSEACPGPAGLSEKLITKHLLSTSCLAVVS